ncbi:hypothetical protein [Mycobacteroides abscessus]
MAERIRQYSSDASTDLIGGKDDRPGMVRELLQDDFAEKIGDSADELA